MAALYICKQGSADVFVNTVKEIMSLSAAHSSFIYAIVKVKKDWKPLWVNVHRGRVWKPDNQSKPLQLGVAGGQIYRLVPPSPFCEDSQEKVIQRGLLE